MVDLAPFYHPTHRCKFTKVIKVSEKDEIPSYIIRQCEQCPKKQKEFIKDSHLYVPEHGVYITTDDKIFIKSNII